MGSTPERRQPAYTATVRDTFPTMDSLTSAADAVTGLMAHPGWAHLCRLLDAETAGLDAQMDGGRLLESRADYAHLHGQRRGLQAAVGLAHAVVREADKRLVMERTRNERGAESPLGRVA